VGTQDIDRSLEGVGILAGDEQDVSVIGGGHGLMLTRREPGEEGFGAHVVID
jgi:hypothetical protein